jgi:uncharacterized protein (TIGR03083 family)
MPSEVEEATVVAQDFWPDVHAERRALAADLADLTAEQWALSSLCGGWSIQQVLAHQVSTASLNPIGFLTKFAGAGFNFGKFTERGVAAYCVGGPSATLAAYRAIETSTSAPPGPKDTWLGETLVHCEDIRRPLGIAHDYPLSSVTRVIAFYSRSNTLIGGKNRMAGLTLKATDVDWATGTGPVVEGPAKSLLMAAAGRTAAFEDLTGPGLETLRSR